MRRRAADDPRTITIAIAIAMACAIGSSTFAAGAVWRAPRAAPIALIFTCVLGLLLAFPTYLFLRKHAAFYSYLAPGAFYLSGAIAGSCIGGIAGPAVFAILFFISTFGCRPCP